MILGLYLTGFRFISTNIEIKEVLQLHHKIALSSILAWPLMG
jgi:hypothetical protein